MSEPDPKSEFERLIQRNRGRLAAIAHSYANADEDDLLQEILLQIWKSLKGFERRSNIDTWCYRIALNTALFPGGGQRDADDNAYRRQRRTSI